MSKRETTDKASNEIVDIEDVNPAIDMKEEVEKERAKKELKAIDPEKEPDKLTQAVRNLLPMPAKDGDPASRKTLSTIKKHRFLRAFLENNGRSKVACKAIDIPYQTFYTWLTRDPAFQEAYETAQKALIPIFEDGLREWAFDGIEREIWHKGEKVGTTKDRNALIAMFLMKQLDPSYRENATNIGIAASGDVEISFAEPGK